MSTTISTGVPSIRLRAATITSFLHRRSLRCEAILDMSRPGVHPTAYGPLSEGESFRLRRRGAPKVIAVLSGRFVAPLSIRSIDLGGVN